MNPCNRLLRYRGLFLAWLLGSFGSIVWAQTTVEAQAGTLWKVRQTGQLTLSYRLGAIPFSFVHGDSQQPRGYSIDLCQAMIEPIQQAAGLDKLDVRWVNVEDDTRLPRVVSGEIDIECGMTVASDARAKLVGTSAEIFKSEVRFLVLPSSGIQGLPDLAARRTAFVAGAVPQDLLLAAESKAGILVEHRAQKTPLDAFNALDTGKADAWFVSELAARTTLAQQGRQWSEFAFVGAPLREESYVIALRYNDPALKALLNQTLKKLADTGVMAELRSKWFSRAIDGLGYGLGYD